MLAVLRPCFKFLSFKYHFKALNEWSLIDGYAKDGRPEEV